MELPHVSYMSLLGFISQTKKNLFDVLYLDEGRLWVWVYFTSAGGFMWLNSRFMCFPLSDAAPRLLQENQRYLSQLTSLMQEAADEQTKSIVVSSPVLNCRGSFWCQVGRHSKVQTGPAEWFLVVVGFLTFLQNWIPHSFFCFLASNNFRDSFM